MQDKYKEKLQKIFFGNAPKFLLDAPVELTTQVFALQGMEYTYDGPLPADTYKLNFTKFVQDVYVLDKDRVKDMDGLSEVEIKRACGIYMRAEFYEWIEDAASDNWQKLLKCIYYRGFLMAFVRTYNIEIIDNQLTFVKELLGTENYYTKLIEQEIEPFLVWERQQVLKKLQHQFLLASNCPYDEIKLNLLCEELKDGGFIENTESFKQVFDSNSNDKCCWIKTTSSLKYLLWLLLDKGSDKVKPGTLHLLCNRFVVKGKPVTAKVVQSTDITAYMDIAGVNLKGHYERLHAIIKSVKIQ